MEVKMMLIKPEVSRNVLLIGFVAVLAVSLLFFNPLGSPAGQQWVPGMPPMGGGVPPGGGTPPGGGGVPPGGMQPPAPTPRPWCQQMTMGVCLNFVDKNNNGILDGDEVKGEPSKPACAGNSVSGKVCKEAEDHKSAKCEDATFKCYCAPGEKDCIQWMGRSMPQGTPQDMEKWVCHQCGADAYPMCYPSCLDYGMMGGGGGQMFGPSGKCDTFTTGAADNDGRINHDCDSKNNNAEVKHYVPFGLPKVFDCAKSDPQGYYDSYVYYKCNAKTGGCDKQVEKCQELKGRAIVGYDYSGMMPQPKWGEINLGSTPCWWYENVESFYCHEPKTGPNGEQIPDTWDVDMRTVSCQVCPPGSIVLPGGDNPSIATHYINGGQAIFFPDSQTCVDRLTGECGVFCKQRGGVKSADVFPPGCKKWQTADPVLGTTDLYAGIVCCVCNT